MHKHPNQPIVVAKDGCIRFEENKIVHKLLKFATERGYGLNEIIVEFRDDEDYIQLMQLIGYSVSGYGDLSVIPKKEVKRADRKAYKLAKNMEKKKNG